MTDGKERLTVDAAAEPNAWSLAVGKRKDASAGTVWEVIEAVDRMDAANEQLDEQEPPRGDAHNCLHIRCWGVSGICFAGQAKKKEF